MTLQQFLSLTSATPPAVVRHAMVVALAMEPARTRDACARFYCRVVLALGLATESRCGDAGRHGTGVAALSASGLGYHAPALTDAEMIGESSSRGLHRPTQLVPASR